MGKRLSAGRSPDGIETNPARYADGGNPQSGIRRIYHAARGSHTSVSKPDDTLVDAVRDMRKYILEVRLPASAYDFDESKIDFEFYDERCHIRPDATAEIYVPVVKRA